MVRFLPAGALFLALFLVPRSGAQQADEFWKSVLGKALAEDGAKDYAKAEQTFLQALHEAERFGPDDIRVAETLSELGANYRHQHKLSEAESAGRRALTITEKNSEEDSMEVGDATFNLAIALVEEGKQAAAIPLIQKSLGIFEKTLGGFHPKTASALCILGDSYRSMHAFADAERPLRRCADIREGSGGMENPEFAEALHSLALTYAAEGKLALAEPRFTLAEKIREKTLGITSPLLAKTMEDHAALLKQMGRDLDAAKLRAMAAAIMRSSGKK